MADEADMAQANSEFLASLPLPQSPPLPPTGHCYNCDEPLPDTLRFCDKDCRDDWEARNLC